MRAGTAADRHAGGRSLLTVSAVLDEQPACELKSVLDPLAEDVSWAPGLPPMWHWVYLLPDWRQSDLGPDGHPSAGVPAPPAPGHRRMFAGGRTTHLHPLVLGERAERRVEVTGTVETEGRSGPLTFVTVRNQVEQAGRTLKPALMR